MEFSLLVILDVIFFLVTCTAFTDFTLMHEYIKTHKIHCMYYIW